MRTMWFGTKERSRWIKVHSPGSDPSMANFSSRLDFANGGVGLRQSLNGHLEQTLTWNRVTDQEAREITDYAYGYGGEGHLYLSDPGAMDKNVLNRAWSMPAIAAADGVPLAGKKRPEIVKNYDGSLDYPVDMARYQLTASDARRSFYVPIPPGHVAWVGAHGDEASDLGLEIQPTLRGQASGSPISVAVTAVDSTARVTNSATPAGDQAGIEISIAPGAGTVTLAGVIVQVLPAGVTPEPGGFISGRGAGGMEIEGKPQVSPYSYYHDSYGLSMKLVETEAWR